MAPVDYQVGANSLLTDFQSQAVEAAGDDRFEEVDIARDRRL
jgi:hypothetical protein